MPKNRFYLPAALVTFGAVFAFCFTAGALLQMLLHYALFQIIDMVGGKPLPYPLEFYRNNLIEDFAPTFLLCLIPGLLFGLYLLILGRLAPKTDTRFAYLALGAIVTIALVLSFVCLTLAVCLGPFLPFGGRMMTEDYHAPIFSQAIFYTAILLLLANLFFPALCRLAGRRKRSSDGQKDG
ncbi:hypothetical protein BH09VER1_BH09VER1_05590 [soil metagenome]